MMERFKMFIEDVYKVYNNPKKKFELKKIRKNYILRARLFPGYCNRLLTTKNKDYAFRIVSESFIYNPSIINPVANGDTFAKSLRKIKITDSFSRRFKKILDSNEVKSIYEDNIFPNLLKYIASQNSGIKINYYQLLCDLYFWRNDIKEKWVKDFYGCNISIEEKD